MLIIEAANRVTKSKENQDDIPGLTDALDRLFDIDLVYTCAWYADDRKEHRERLKGYWLNRWYCTDTHVGVMAYFLDDELVMIATQTSRGACTVLEFISTDAHGRVKDFVEHFRTFDIEEPMLLDLSEKIDPVVVFPYADNCLHKFGYYKGERVAVNRISMFEAEKLGVKPSSFSNPNVFILREGQTEKESVSIHELTFDLHIDGK